MASHEDRVPSHYPCLTQKDGLRRVHHPHAERGSSRRGGIRRTFARLAAALRP